ncbi:MAG: hypothetical protein MZV63_13300, partial [Marinilabiliales bacterium]|nr:hypothetical protein [Marinilabiliales bacterium]
YFVQCCNKVACSSDTDSAPKSASGLEQGSLRTLNNSRVGMLRYGELPGLYSAAELEARLNSGSRTYNLYAYENQVRPLPAGSLPVALSSRRFSPEWNDSGVALHYAYGRR